MSKVDPPPPTVVVTRDGPYVVTGPVSMSYQVIATDDQDMSWTWKQGADVPVGRKFSLCRCGKSANKPFCDDSHLAIHFDGTETASRAPYADQADVIDGPTMTLSDAESLCVYARFCDGHGRVWNAVEQTSSDEARRVTAHESTHCPGGRLVATDKATGATIEPVLERAIGLIEDPGEGVSGGLWLRGGISVTSEDGTPYPVRNRVVLCRCGASSNKPFCDGSHASPAVRFRDDVLAKVDTTPDGTDSVVTPTV